MCIRDRGVFGEVVSHQLGEPMDEESYLVDNEVYEVRFYKVNSRWREKPPEHLPVIFKDGVVVGTNMKIYNQVRKKAGYECIDCYTPAVDRMQEDAAEQNFNYW